MAGFFDVISDAGEFLLKLPIIGESLQTGVEAFKGTAERSAGLAVNRAEQEREAQRAFQSGQEVGAGASVALSGLLSNPILLLGAVLVVILIVRGRK